jgi:hypothetical protein
MQPGIWLGFIVLTEGQTLENQSSSSNQQLSWSEGPSGEHESGATATLQRQSVVRFSVAQPSLAGVRSPDVTQLDLAQAGKPESSTGDELSFVGVEVSRARIVGRGAAAANGRPTVAMVTMKVRESMLEVENGVSAALF